MTTMDLATSSVPSVDGTTIAFERSGARAPVFREFLA
jgi:hypothetical protein